MTANCLRSSVGRTRAREREVVHGLRVAVAAQVEVSDVVLDLAGGGQVAVLQEHVARAQARLDGLLEAAEERERDELADARRAGSVWLAETLEAGLGLVEAADGLL